MGEHLAKVGVEGSNPFARSNLPKDFSYLDDAAKSPSPGTFRVFGALVGHQLGKISLAGSGAWQSLSPPRQKNHGLDLLMMAMIIAATITSDRSG